MTTKRTTKSTTKPAAPALGDAGFSSDKKEVLTEKRLDSVLHVNRGKARIKSVSSPFAQTVIQCAPRTDTGWDYVALEARYNQLKRIDERVSVIFDLQFAGGCRISEVLNVKCTDIDDLGKVTIKGLKGGDTRIVQSSFSAKFLLKTKSLGVSPFHDLNRFYVYRTYKKLGISEFYGDNQRASVTHLPRHEVALASKLLERDETVTKRQLGQKSAKSTAHYTGKERGKKPSQ